LEKKLAQSRGKMLILFGEENEGSVDI